VLSPSSAITLILLGNAVTRIKVSTVLRLWPVASICCLSCKGETLGISSDGP
jgi:hypothetical protein